jgi:hypothetical protein
MRIINVGKRVGKTYGDYRYEAFVDFENDVTKYSAEFEKNGTVNYKKRFSKGVFTMEELQKAYNFYNFTQEIAKQNRRWHIKQRKMDILFRIESIKRRFRTFKENLFKELSTQ